ncbi:MAG: M18 family aminopeptidase, partial [Erysipelotrichales bacterium]|nr:M18 family aminopeptidase [Erysipelotrichales bacterium]
VIWGSDSEYIGCPRIDNLECAYTSLTGFINAGCTNGNLNVYACFDNEEVGSGTKQGAASTFLYDTVQRAITSLGLTQEDYLRAVANGMIVSADNAHALHPNHGELFDAQNHAYMNEGIAIKHNAAQSYTTEGVSNAVFQDICASVNVPTQYFTNRSDLRGGGTLGSISSTQVSILSVDIGLPQLAMHSSFECAGVKDVEYMIQALTAFYSAHISKVDDTHYQIQY